jgi:hypothetical protein
LTAAPASASRAGSAEAEGAGVAADGEGVGPVVAQAASKETAAARAVARGKWRKVGLMITRHCTGRGGAAQHRRRAAAAFDRGCNRAVIEGFVDHTVTI